MTLVKTPVGVQEFVENCWLRGEIRVASTNQTENLLRSMLVRWSQSWFVQQKLSDKFTRSGWPTFLEAAIAFYRSNDKAATTKEIEKHITALSASFGTFSADTWRGRARAYAMLVIPELVKALPGYEEHKIFEFLPHI